MITEIHTPMTGTIKTDSSGNLIFEEGYLTDDLRESLSKQYSKLSVYVGLPDIGRLLGSIDFVLGIGEAQVEVISNGLPEGGLVIDDTLVE
jgi:hypothetical protein